MRNALLPVILQRLSCTVAVLFLLLPNILAVAENPPSQVELNGFLLGQYKKILESTFGEPFKEVVHDDGWIDQFFSLDPDTESYMIFGVSSKDDVQIIAIQITGNSSPAMFPFLGLRLGDSKSKVLDVLGEPSSIKPVVIPDLNLDLKYYIYEGKNYSVEINELDKLYSIRLVGYDGFLEKVQGMPAIEKLKDCVRSNNAECLVNILAPDFEAFKDSKAITYSTAARRELANPASPLVRLLRGTEKSLRSVFLDEKMKGDAQLRVYEKGGSGWVFKYPESKIIREIVYTYYAGGWRAWEIWFHDSNLPTP